MSEPGPPDPSRHPAAELVRSADLDLYAATLFAPAPARPHLFALYAFDIELARVRELVSQPMPGELRLQWWRDALENPDRADVRAHPVARGLEAAIAYGQLPRTALLDLIDARGDDLYDDPIPSVEALEARLGATASAVLRLACLIVAAGEEPGGAEAAGCGGVALGLVRLLRVLPRQAARGQILFPVDRMAAHGVTRDDMIAGRATPELAGLARELRELAARRLSEARAAFPQLDAKAAAAFLPLAGVDPELRRLDRAPPFAPPAPLPAWRRLFRVWRMSRRAPPF